MRPVYVANPNSFWVQLNDEAWLAPQPMPVPYRHLEFKMACKQCSVKTQHMNTLAHDCARDILIVRTAGDYTNKWL